MKQLKTNCLGCKFSALEKCYCELGREVFLNGKENSQFTRGFCSWKRLVSWRPDCNHRIIECLQEEQTLSVIILSLDNDIEKIKTTIKSLGDKYIHKVIVVTNKINPEIMSFLKDSGLKWTLRMITSEDNEIDKLGFIDNATIDAESTWVFSIIAGDTIDSNDIANIHKDIEITPSSCLIFYYDENDPIKVAFSLQAFEELQGHYELPFFEKIKTFDDWREFCKKIK